MASTESKSKRRKAKDEYAVENITDVRFNEERQRIEYLIKWAGYSDDENTWEGVDNLTGCKSMIQEFHEKRLANKIATPGNANDALDAVFLKDFGTVANSRQWIVKKIGTGSYNVVFRGCETNAPSAAPSPSPSNSESENQAHGSGSSRNDAPSRQDQNDSLTTTSDPKTTLKKWIKSVNRICRAAGEAPLRVENDVDDAILPSKDFVYITALQPEKDVIIPKDPIIGCSCVRGGSCSKKDRGCCAPGMDGEFAYTKDGHLRLPPGRPIYECNKRCTCGEGCSNRVVQKGRKVELCIFRTDDRRGWGVKSVVDLKKNTFVTEYVGEVLKKKVADDRPDDSYMFEMDFDVSVENVIDAKYYGNVARFINHSCEPNLAVYGVWIEHYENNLPRLAFFTNRDIKAGEELTFDYYLRKQGSTNTSMSSSMSDDEDLSLAVSARRVSNKNRKQVKCLCGSDACQKYPFPAD